MLKFDELRERIYDADRIVITAHTSPDGDAIGSSLGLYGLLKKIKDDVLVVFKEYPQDDLSFLPWFSNLVIDPYFEVRENDLIIVLDCGNTERINLNIDVKIFKNNIVNIDHHKSNENYGILNWVDDSKAAVGEMIYELANELKITIDEKVGECLYTSILTDTGGFKYSNTSKNTHLIAGELIQTGISFTEIYERIFDFKSYKQIKLYSKAIESIRLYHNESLCIMEISMDDIAELDAQNEDLGDLINLGMKISSVEVALMLKEKGNLIKGSLRSKKKIDVCELARVFDGGGHIRAAGFSSELSGEEIKKIIIEKLKGRL